MKEIEKLYKSKTTKTKVSKVYVVAGRGTAPDKKKQRGSETRTKHVDKRLKGTKLRLTDAHSRTDDVWISQPTSVIRSCQLDVTSRNRLDTALMSKFSCVKQSIGRSKRQVSPKECSTMKTIQNDLERCEVYYASSYLPVNGSFQNAQLMFRHPGRSGRSSLA